MRKFVTIGLLLGSLIPGAALMPGPALAQGVELYIDGGGPRYDDGRRYYDDEDYGDDYYRDRSYRDRQYRDRRAQRRICTPQRALAIARAEGLQNARVGRTTNQWIEIRGSHRRTIVFGLQPNCPVRGYNNW
ncbi:hypothetical protein PWG15_10355 [Ensifer adhaerens]|uniref:hypothetical protein n=1 Tax=Ensifer adhaerens TaxID=106592 RepID=UPI0023A9B444|nr:hypothetical protein [Ensifer adhaerens]WDZ78858.1 hypothetical protein PWG15_10355 [Ensifer adhaerens]